MNPLIMLYGRDATLLWTRQMILEQAQFRVGTSTDPAELYRALASAPIQILILCHTVPEQERESIRRHVYSSLPGLRVLSLATSDDPTLVPGYAAGAFFGPKTFLEAVRAWQTIPPPHASL